MPDERTQRRLLLGVGAVLVVVAVVVAAAALLRDDGDDVEAAPSTTTEPTTTSTAAPSTTTTTSAPTSTTFAPSVDPALVIWPRPETSQRFEDPVAAARSFAVDLVGFTDPVVGDLREGDSRSGEVPVHPADPSRSPETTVLVRQMEDGTWWVIASVVQDITLDQPAAGDVITCPLHLTGTALAFEGHVDVALYDDVAVDPVATGFVTGGGGPAAPFDDTLDCTLPAGREHGTVILTTQGGEDGRIWQAVAQRVRFTPG